MDIEKYYIGHKQYIPEESYKLCEVCSGDSFEIMNVERKVLYRTEKGSYFLVYSHGNKVDVSVIDETGAFEFMDKNASGIDIGIYNKLFREPERG